MAVSALANGAPSWCRLLLTIALASTAFASTPTAAQTGPAQVAGRLVDEARQPVDAAFVRVVDARDSVVAQRLTDAAGNFALTLRETGSYRIRVEVLGGRPWLSPPFDVFAGRNELREFVVPATAIPLDPIDVNVGRQCRTPPEDGPRIVELYNRLQVAAADLARATAAVAPFTVRRVLQTLRVTPRGPDDPYAALGWRHTGTSELQLRRVLSGPEYSQLERVGYIIPDSSVLKDHWYVVPTPEIIARSEFLENHCFGIRTHGDSAWRGLTFEPHASVRTIDVQGVLWFDTASGVLRRLEYQYTRIDDFIRTWVVPDTERRMRNAYPQTSVVAGTFTYRRASDFGGYVDYDLAPATCLTPVQWQVRRPWGAAVGMHAPGMPFLMNVEVHFHSDTFTVLARGRDGPC